MNPYQVLGVTPMASRDEIEAAYRHLLRVHHPDLHHGGSPDEISEAESTTRQLNEAMALVRAGWQEVPGSATGFQYDDRDWGGGPGPAHWPRQPASDGATAGAGAGPGADPGRDWFGNPMGRPHRAESVNCPLCNQVFNDPALYRLHLLDAHDLGGPAPAEARVARDRFEWLTWVPAPTFWLVTMLIIYWIAVTRFVPDPWWTAAIWLGLVPFGLALNKAVRGRRRP